MEWIHDFTVAAAVLIAMWFWKPWAGAYAGEKGKNLARKEDIDSLVTEVRATTQTAEQIKAQIQSGLADRERQMAWRIGAYMQAVEAATRLNNIFGQLANLEMQDRDIFETLPSDLGSLAKIQLIAADDTLAAVGNYQEGFNSLMIELAMEKALLRLQIDHGTFDELQLAKLKFAFLARCLNAVMDLAQLTIPAIVTIREEMEIPLDEGRFTHQANEAIVHLRESTKAALQTFDELLNDPSAAERLLGKTASVGTG